MTKSWIVVAVCAVAFAGGQYVEGQRSNSGRPGSGSGQGPGAGQMSGQQGGRGTGQQQTVRDQQQTRVQSLATQRQRTTARESVSATKQLRSQLRTMMKLGKGQQVGTEQAKQWREQVRAQLRLMQQQQQEMLTSLTPEQQAFVQDDIDQMNEDTAGMVEFVEALESVLDEKEIDEATLEQNAKKADNKAKKVESEQNQIMSELDLL
ncbi:MAG TPA: hypothetical protein VN577_00795 [Terriglobales bacterium]|nr:hypothetical protein [Terriglobales bacterium]